MEIKIVANLDHCSKEFKIDLIVWKSKELKANKIKFIRV